ncbi:MAG: class I SAM-dependent methyltransferase, partial [Flavobacteriales bacterium]
MNNSILHKEIQNFIRSYSLPLSKLAFAGSPFSKVTVQELMQQIESRLKIKSKLPTWYKNHQIYYPPKLNLEQTSSELTAKYKASLISGSSLADISGGFGVDSYYFSNSINRVDSFEINGDLSEIAKHNFNILKKSNIHCYQKDGLEQVLQQAYQFIYADPSRRNDTKGKVYLLEDCEPNIPKNIDKLLNQCSILMLKTSPMLDISAGLSELKRVSQIHIVAINNEVKELIWLLEKDSDAQPDIYTVNLKKSS